jgi:REP element-mobilizing transposase RayT
MNGKPRAYYLPRLGREFYQGAAAVHWTLTVFDRGTGWLNDSFHSRFRELMLHVAAREGLLCPIYCLMPDHIHLLWLGLRRDTDQLNGMSFLRTHLKPLLLPHKFQPQAHDHVLREEERKRGAFAKIGFYILANPVRAHLIGESESWPFCGAVIPGYPALHPLAEDFWPKFWKIYPAARPSSVAALRRVDAPDAGERKLPPRSSQPSESRHLDSH